MKGGHDAEGLEGLISGILCTKSRPKLNLVEERAFQGSIGWLPRGEGGLHPGVLGKLGVELVQRICTSKRRKIGQGDSLESGFQKALCCLFLRKSHLAKDATLPPQ